MNRSDVSFLSSAIDFARKKVSSLLPDWSRTFLEDLQRFFPGSSTDSVHEDWLVILERGIRGNEGLNMPSRAAVEEMFWRLRESSDVKPLDDSIAQVFDNRDYSSDDSQAFVEECFNWFCQSALNENSLFLIEKFDILDGLLLILIETQVPIVKYHAVRAIRDLAVINPLNVVPMFFLGAHEVLFGLLENDWKSFSNGADSSSLSLGAIEMVLDALHCLAFFFSEFLEVDISGEMQYLETCSQTSFLTANYDHQRDSPLTHKERLADMLSSPVGGCRCDRCAKRSSSDSEVQKRSETAENDATRSQHGGSLEARVLAEHERHASFSADHFFLPLLYSKSFLCGELGHRFQDSDFGVEGRHARSIVIRLTNLLLPLSERLSMPSSGTLMAYCPLARRDSLVVSHLTMGRLTRLIEDMSHRGKSVRHLLRPFVYILSESLDVHNSEERFRGADDEHFVEAGIGFIEEPPDRTSLLTHSLLILQTILYHSSRFPVDIADDPGDVRSEFASHGGMKIMLSILQSLQDEPRVASAAIAVLHEVISGHERNKLFIQSSFGFAPFTEILVKAGVEERDIFLMALEMAIKGSSNIHTSLVLGSLEESFGGLSLSAPPPLESIRVRNNPDAVHMILGLLFRSGRETQKLVLRSLLLLVECSVSNMKILSGPSSTHLLLWLALNYEELQTYAMQLLAALCSYSITDGEARLFYELALYPRPLASLIRWLRSDPLMRALLLGQAADQAAGNEMPTDLLLGDESDLEEVTDKLESEEFQMQLLYVIGRISERNDPSSYYSFDGISEALVFPPLDKLPSPKVGYTFTCWIKPNFTMKQPLRVGSLSNPSPTSMDSMLLCWQEANGNVPFQLFFKSFRSTMSPGSSGKVSNALSQSDAGGTALWRTPSGISAMRSSTRSRTYSSGSSASSASYNYSVEHSNLPLPVLTRESRDTDSDQSPRPEGARGQGTPQMSHSHSLVDVAGVEVRKRAHRRTQSSSSVGSLGPVVVPHAAHLGIISHGTVTSDGVGTFSPAVVHRGRSSSVSQLGWDAAGAARRCLCVRIRPHPSAPPADYVFDGFSFPDSKASTWYHVAFSQTRKAVKMYINGQLIQSFSSHSYPHVSKEKPIRGFVGCAPPHRMALNAMSRSKPEPKDSVPRLFLDDAEKQENDKKVDDGLPLEKDVAARDENADVVDAPPSKNADEEEERSAQPVKSRRDHQRDCQLLCGQIGGVAFYEGTLTQADVMRCFAVGPLSSSDAGPAYPTVPVFSSILSPTMDGRAGPEGRETEEGRAGDVDGPLVEENPRVLEPAVAADLSNTGCHLTAAELHVTHSMKEIMSRPLPLPPLPPILPEGAVLRGLCGVAQAFLFLDGIGQGPLIAGLRIVTSLLEKYQPNFVLFDQKLKGFDVLYHLLVTSHVGIGRPSGTAALEVPSLVQSESANVLDGAEGEDTSGGGGGEERKKPIVQMTSPPASRVRPVLNGDIFDVLLDLVSDGVRYRSHTRVFSFSRARATVLVLDLLCLAPLDVQKRTWKLLADLIEQSNENLAVFRMSRGFSVLMEFLSADVEFEIGELLPLRQAILRILNRIMDTLTAEETEHLFDYLITNPNENVSVKAEILQVFVRKLQRQMQMQARIGGGSESEIRSSAADVPLGSFAHPSIAAPLSTPATPRPSVTPAPRPEAGVDTVVDSATTEKPPDGAISSVEAVSTVASSGSVGVNTTPSYAAFFTPCMLIDRLKAIGGANPSSEVPSSVAVWFASISASLPGRADLTMTATAFMNSYASLFVLLQSPNEEVRVYAVLLIGYLLRLDREYASHQVIWRQDLTFNRIFGFLMMARTLAQFPASSITYTALFNVSLGRLHPSESSQWDILPSSRASHGGNRPGMTSNSTGDRRWVARLHDPSEPSNSLSSKPSVTRGVPSAGIPRSVPGGSARVDAEGDEGTASSAEDQQKEEKDKIRPREIIYPEALRSVLELLRREKRTSLQLQVVNEIRDLCHYPYNCDILWECEWFIPSFWEYVVSPPRSSAVTPPVDGVSDGASVDDEDDEEDEDEDDEDVSDLEYEESDDDVAEPVKKPIEERPTPSDAVAGPVSTSGMSLLQSLIMFAVRKPYKRRDKNAFVRIVRDSYENEFMLVDLMSALIDYLRNELKFVLPDAEYGDILKNAVILLKDVEHLSACTPSFALKVINAVNSLTVQNSSNVRTSMKKSGLLEVRDQLILYWLWTTETMSRAAVPELVLDPAQTPDAPAPVGLDPFAAPAGYTAGGDASPRSPGALSSDEEGSFASDDDFQEPRPTPAPFSLSGSPLPQTKLPRSEDSAVFEEGVNQFFEWFYGTAGERKRRENVQKRIQKLMGSIDQRYHKTQEKFRVKRTKRLRKRGEQREKEQRIAEKGVKECVEKVENQRKKQQESHERRLENLICDRESRAIVGREMWEQIIRTLVLSFVGYNPLLLEFDPKEESLFSIRQRLCQRLVVLSDRSVLETVAQTSPRLGKKEMKERLKKEKKEAERRERGEKERGRRRKREKKRKKGKIKQ